MQQLSISNSKLDTAYRETIRCSGAEQRRRAAINVRHLHKPRIQQSCLQKCEFNRSCELDDRARTKKRLT